MEKEIRVKWERVKRLLAELDLNGIVLNKVSNFAWFTGGKRNFVGLHTESGASSLLITKRKIYLLTNNIEYPRVFEEEVKSYNFEPVVEKWYRQEDLKKKVEKIVKGKAGCDCGWEGFVPVKIEKLHFPLIEEEIKRYKKLGKETSEIITEICREVKQGEREIEIAGKISERLWKRNIIPVVLLIACDERIKKYRHPIPTSKKLKKHLMVVVCAKRNGLIVSLTRFVHFGKLPSQLKRKHESVCLIDAAFIMESVPGKKVKDVFQKGVEMYKKTGFEKEWELHHQGGLTGYMTRYYKGYKTIEDEITPSQSFAWNPSITGTKSEDTIITTSGKPLIITEDKRWPLMEIEYEGVKVLRPLIMIK